MRTCGGEATYLKFVDVQSQFCAILLLTQNPIDAVVRPTVFRTKLEWRVNMGSITDVVAIVAP